MSVVQLAILVIVITAVVAIVVWFARSSGIDPAARHRLLRDPGNPRDSFDRQSGRHRSVTRQVAMMCRIVWPLVVDCVLVTVISAALFYALVQFV
jgi:predicted anti-sigma-YlaC factor YlaD